MRIAFAKRFGAYSKQIPVCETSRSIQCSNGHIERQISGRALGSGNRLARGGGSERTQGPRNCVSGKHEAGNGSRESRSLTAALAQRFIHESPRAENATTPRSSERVVADVARRGT